MVDTMKSYRYYVRFKNAGYNTWVTVEDAENNNDGFFKASRSFPDAISISYPEEQENK